jgi:hypothetical protein
MSWRSFFVRQKPPEPAYVDPVARLCLAVDEVNAAVAALPPERRRLRPWTLPADRTTGSTVKVVVGYWHGGEQCFRVVYDGGGRLEMGRLP